MGDGDVYGLNSYYNRWGLVEIPSDPKIEKKFLRSDKKVYEQIIGNILDDVCKISGDSEVDPSNVVGDRGMSFIWGYALCKGDFGDLGDVAEKLLPQLLHDILRASRSKGTRCAPNFYSIIEKQTFDYQSVNVLKKKRKEYDKRLVKMFRKNPYEYYDFSQDKEEFVANNMYAVPEPSAYLKLWENLLDMDFFYLGDESGTKVDKIDDTMNNNLPLYVYPTQKFFDFVKIWGMKKDVLSHEKKVELIKKY